MHFLRWTLWVVLGVVCLSAAAQGTAYKYFRVGSAQDRIAKPRAGYALMGGGTDLDEAFRWMCQRAGGGDFLILRAAGTDAYNPYVQGLQDGKSCRLNSVATLVIPDKAAANDRFVAEAIAHAEAILIAGGDQANYIRYWTGTPVQAGINAAIARGVPLGGTSAGLAVMGEWVYSAEGDKAEDPNLDSKLALGDPTGPRVTLVHGFLDIPVLKGIITDSHFAKRDRMGRLFAFLRRISAQGDTGIRGLGIDEREAVLMEPDGRATVVGKGKGAYLVSQPPAGAPGETFEGHFEVRRLRTGDSFDLRKRCCGDASYRISVENGRLVADGNDGSVY